MKFARVRFYRVKKKVGLIWHELHYVLKGPRKSIPKEELDFHPKDLSTL